MKWLAVAITAWALAGAAQAQDWVYAAHGGGSAQGYDADSVTRSGTLRTVDVVVVAAETQTLPSGRTWDYLVTREQLDCTNFRRRVMTSTTHRFGQPQPTEVHTEPGQWLEPTVAGSVSGVLVRGVCSDTRPDSMGFTTAVDFARAARRVFEGGAA